MNLETRLPASLWEAIRTNHEKGNFTGAILDAFYFLSDLLRNKSGAEGDGAALIGQALGGATPKIKLNRLQTESELNVQKGLEQLLRGFYQAIRNPRSHEKIADSEEDAQVIIAFIGYLVRQIDQAKAQFSLSDFRMRVLDPDFLPQQRYAELLIKEIPVGQRFDVFLDVYRAKEAGKPDHLRHFFKVLLPLLTDDERRQVYEVISEELKTADDDTTIRLAIGSFEGDIWPHIDEVVRLRIENRLIRSVKEGRFDRGQRKCRGGSLGTWSTRLLTYFSLKQEFLCVIWYKLRSSSDEEEDYVFEYLFAHLASLADTMPASISMTFERRLKQGNLRFYNILLISCPWPSESWDADLRKVYEHFEEAEETADDLDDDIPF